MYKIVRYSLQKKLMQLYYFITIKVLLLYYSKSTTLYNIPFQKKNHAILWSIQKYCLTQDQYNIDFQKKVM